MCCKIIQILSILYQWYHSNSILFAVPNICNFIFLYRKSSQFTEIWYIVVVAMDKRWKEQFVKSDKRWEAQMKELRKIIADKKWEAQMKELREMITNCSTEVPRRDLPIFEGINPRLWLRQCNKYFKVYNIPEN